MKRLVGRCSVAVGLAVSLVAAGAGPSEAGVDPAPSPATSKVLVVSGSSLNGVTSHKAFAGFQGAEFTFDLRDCRRTHGTSCSVFGRTRPTTVLEVVQSRGSGHDVLIVFAGYNEGPSTLSKGFDLVVAAARTRGIDHIIWATLRTNHDYTSSRIAGLNAKFVQSNAMLRGKIASGAFPDVTLADWDTYSTHEHTWFIKDGIHFKRPGAWGAADYLSRKLAFVEGRACPQPRAPGEAPQDPCPDPDLRRPDVDLAALYPIGSAPYSCFDVPADTRIECQPTALVGQITSTLAYGASGAEVRALQIELKNRGFLPSWAVSRTYDRRTFQAVMAYQRWRELPLSGVAGPATRAALGFGCPELGGPTTLGSLCPADGQPTYFLVPTRMGSSGFLVTLLQQQLKDLGLFSAIANGVFGSKTRTALRAFQQANSLPVTGVADAATVTALGFVPLS